MNGKLEWMWKEAFLVSFLSQLLPRGTDDKLLCQSSRSAGPDFENRTSSTLIVCSKEEKKGTKRQKERRNNSECMASKVIRAHTMKKK